jgi:hypothetical protein
MRSYFAENATFSESYFNRRFQMRINLFKRIAEDLKKYDRFFEQRRNAGEKLGHSTEQKTTAALCMLVYGILDYLYLIYLIVFDIFLVVDFCLCMRQHATFYRARKRCVLRVLYFTQNRKNGAVIFLAHICWRCSNARID